ncbi:hypothetical protein PcP3B5_23450 [Pseudomonas citronellolis]|nr:hypothetical protein PcP3B5_23450 [Pseudomonas citronellolis]
MPGLQGQPGDFAGGQRGALVAGRQQADVAEHQHRQVGLQLADFQLGLGELHLAGHAQAAVVVRRAAVAAHRQQAAVGALGAAVQLQAQYADGVQAEADGPRGVAGTEVEDEALGPLLRFGLPVGPDDVGEVAAEVVVACLQGGAGTFDQPFGRGRRLGGGHADAQRDGGHAYAIAHGFLLFLWLCDPLPSDRRAAAWRRAGSHVPATGARGCPLRSAALPCFRCRVALGGRPGRAPACRCPVVRRARRAPRVEERGGAPAAGARPGRRSGPRRPPTGRGRTCPRR